MVDLDAHQQTAQEVLIGELSYNLPNSASYIVDRRTQSYFTSSAGNYRADGVRTFSITMTGDNVWADLSTLSLSFTVKNTSPIPDNPPARQWLQAKADGPWCLFKSRYRSTVHTDKSDLLSMHMLYASSSALNSSHTS